MNSKFRLIYLKAMLLFSAMPCFAQTPVFTNAAVINGLFQFQLKTVVGQSYTFQTSTDLLNWTNVGSVTDVTTNLLSLVDSGHPAANFSRMFYRALVGASVSFSFNFHEYVNAGNFGAALTPAITFPVSLNSYAADFDVQNDTSFPSATNVFFTGPAGSGLSDTAADPNDGATNSNEADYQSPNVSSPAAAPGGAWTVNYKGTNENFNVSDPQANSRLVIPVPTASVSGNLLQSVSWVYQNSTTGATLGGAPAYVTSIQLQIDGYVGGRIYNSPDLAPGVTSNTLTSSVNWTNVSEIYMAYNDTLGNQYVVSFQKP